MDKTEKKPSLTLEDAVDLAIAAGVNVPVLDYAQKGNHLHLFLYGGKKLVIPLKRASRPAAEESPETKKTPAETASPTEPRA